MYYQSAERLVNSILTTEYRRLSIISDSMIFEFKRVNLVKNLKQKEIFADYPEILDVKDLCKMLNLSKWKIYEMVKNGTIKKIPGCNTIKVAKVTVIDYVLQNTQN